MPLFLVLLCINLFAYDNKQKIYETTNEVYQTLKLIYIAKGHALPSTTGPWSGDELITMLCKIDRDRLSEALQAQYDWVYSNNPDHGIPNWTSQLVSNLK